MLFNSLEFLFLFLPITYVVFWMLRTLQQRHVWLTVTGYVFYGFWNYKFCALMAFSTLVSYLAGLGLLRFQDPVRRRLCVILAITTDLLLLGFFKYAGFAFESFNSVAGWLGSPVKLPALSIVLPIGISFYTFHTITYIVDSYRRVITPTRSFFEFSCYVSLFSQLVAGPIVRFREVEKDLETLDQAKRTARLDLGCSYFCIGLAKKVLVADTIAAFIDPALRDHQNLGTVDVWLCVLGYAYQLYFDFSGYSDMAVGLGHLFGIHIPRNFNSPYKALDIADFWRRWHISLSSCLRDYLYIPLGGNRDGPWKTHRNLLLTMLLGGLWHGANWTFVFWGAYHGLLLIIFRAISGSWERVPAFVRRAATFFLVVIGWVFFRAENFSMALSLLGTMFSWEPGNALTGMPVFGVALALAAAIAHAAPNTSELGHRWGRGPVLGWTAVYAACVFQIYAGEQSPFLYFQF